MSAFRLYCIFCIFFVVSTAGCATSAISGNNDKPREASHAKTEPGNLVEHQGGCRDKHLNKFGYPDQCNCPSGFTYNAVIGKCAKAGRICTMVISTMIHPKTGKCTDARNGCMASDLKSEGWRNLEPSDHCAPSK